jgi:hypothetical protein
MNRRVLKKLLPAALLLTAILHNVPAQKSSKKNKIPSTSITGSYSFKRPSAENSLDAQLLPDGKVKIYMYASWIGNAATGNVNNGEIKTTLPLKNNVAVYESGRCRITIRFTGRSAMVTERGNPDCGFGLNVSAAGAYAKRSRRTPKFDF